MSDQVHEQENTDLAGRLALAAIGGWAGVAWWFVQSHLASIVSNPQLYLFIVTALAGFLGAILALTGPLPLRRAAFAAIFTAILPAGFLTWASLRYESVADLLARIDMPLAVLILGVLPLPYWVAMVRPGLGWRDYQTLFFVSWSGFVRLSSAVLFAVVFWMAIFLANELLQLAGIELIRTLIAVPMIPPIATGVVVGLALAIINEMEEALSHALIIRLLRLMIFPALLVVGGFAVALPFQGYDMLFGVLSPAGTLLIISGVLVLLVSSAVGAGPGDAVRSSLMRWATRGLALLVPVIAGLALQAIRLRIGEHGLSPGRLAIGLAASVMMAYGVFYTLSVLSGWRWMKRVRFVNSWMALIIVVLAALWLSPAINAEKLSAENQLKRFQAGRLSAETLDVWALRHEWGRPGREVLAVLAQSERIDPALAKRLSVVELAPDRATFDSPTPVVVSGNSRARLKEIMPIQPPEAAAEFDRFVLPWYAGSVSGFLEGCDDKTEAGNPGCVLVVADLLPTNPGNEGILFYKSFGLLRGEVIVPEPIFRRADASEVFSVPPPDFAQTDQILDQIQAGEFVSGPARINAISIGERQFTVPY